MARLVTFDKSNITDCRRILGFDNFFFTFFMTAYAGNNSNDTDYDSMGCLWQQ